MHVFSVPILRLDGHTLDATLLSLSRLTRDTPSTGAVEREDGEDKKQNKNDRGTLHLLKGEKITQNFVRTHAAFLSTVLCAVGEVRLR
jgi:hypothetical protein